MQGLREKGTHTDRIIFDIFAERRQLSLCVGVFILTHVCINVFGDAAVPYIDGENQPISCTVKCSPRLLSRLGVEFGFIAKP